MSDLNDTQPPASAKPPHVVEPKLTEEKKAVPPTTVEAHLNILRFNCPSCQTDIQANTSLFLYGSTSTDTPQVIHSDHHIKVPTRGVNIIILLVASLIAGIFSGNVIVSVIVGLILLATSQIWGKWILNAFGRDVPVWLVICPNCQTKIPVVKREDSKDIFEIFTMSDLKETQSSVTVPPAKKLSRWIPILGFLLLLGLGILGGYQSGLGQRRAAQSTVVFQQLDEQFQLGVQAMNENRYEVALQHFQFVVEHNPSYPGVQEKLTEVLVKLNVTPSPTVTPTPAYSPTPDLRGVEEIFARARELLNVGDWDGAISNLDSLRKSDATYRAAEVDGMYYIALRNRGVGRIIPPSQLCSDINLESGIYDLTLAERFGPLDSYAESLRTWSRYYITGASFWELDWFQVMNYFAQIYPNLPNLMDSSCMTATERYRYATLKYIDKLWMSGDFCTAQHMYDDIFLNVPSEENAIAYPTATQVYDYCLQGGGPTPSISLTPTP